MHLNDFKVACLCAKRWELDEQHGMFGAFAAYFAREKAKFINSPDHKYFLEELDSLYHQIPLPFVAATCLWDAGIQDVNQVGPKHILEGLRNMTKEWRWELCGTPLWVHSRYALELPVLEWLVSKGAQLDWCHPKFGTTPRENISRLATISDCSSSHEFLSKVLWSDFRDDCCCYCSDGGCVAFGHVYKRKGHIIPSTGNLRQSDTLCQTISRGVLRLATFETLSLTHTCCTLVGLKGEPYAFGGKSSRPSREEIVETHYIESQDIQLLESIVSELQEHLDTYDGTLWDFLENIWEPHMLEAMTIRENRHRRNEIMEESGVRMFEICPEEEEGEMTLTQKKLLYPPDCFVPRPEICE